MVIANLGQLGGRRSGEGDDFGLFGLGNQRHADDLLGFAAQRTQKDQITGGHMVSLDVGHMGVVVKRDMAGEDFT